MPPTVDAVYLSIHGGAFMMGSRRSSDQTNWRIAQECNVAVVSPEYRMAPEHQYPAGHDDCEAVAVWLLEHGAAELGSDRLLIGGRARADTSPRSPCSGSATVTTPPTGCSAPT